MLTLPVVPGPVEFAGAFRNPVTIGSLAEMIREERSALAARAASGDARARSVLDMGDGWTDPDIDATAAAIFTHLPAPSGGTFSPEDEALVLAHAFYEAALAASTHGDGGHAVIALAVIPWLGALEAEALCGLAICAVERHQLDDALSFAMAALAHPVKNARACCIAGYCELKRGNRKMAQSLLAAATRVARHNPAFREDMRIAQRLLLALHFD